MLMLRWWRASACAEFEIWHTTSPEIKKEQPTFVNLSSASVPSSSLRVTTPPPPPPHQRLKCQSVAGPCIGSPVNPYSQHQRVVCRWVYLKKTEGGLPWGDCSSNGSLLRYVILPPQLLFQYAGHPAAPALCTMLMFFTIGFCAFGCIMSNSS